MRNEREATDNDSDLPRMGILCDKLTPGQPLELARRGVGATPSRGLREACAFLVGIIKRLAHCTARACLSGALMSQTTG